MDNYFDTAKNMGVYNGQTFYDHNEWRKAAGGGAGGGGDVISQAIERNKQAIQPAIESYNQSIPEIQSKYKAAGEQLEASRKPLQERYQNLLSSIKGQGTEDVNRQTTITNNELGKRGILGDSTLAQQEIQNTTSPLRQKYATLESNTNLDLTNALQNLDKQKSDLAFQESSDVRAIKNAIAQLQAGAAQSGVTQGMQLQANQLQNQLQQAELAQRQKEADIQRQLAERQYNEITLPAAQRSLAKSYESSPSYSSSFLGPYLEQILGGVTGKTSSQSSTAIVGYDSKGLPIYQSRQK